MSSRHLYGSNKAVLWFDDFVVVLVSSVSLQVPFFARPFMFETQFPRFRLQIAEMVIFVGRSRLKRKSILCCLSSAEVVSKIEPEFVCGKSLYTSRYDKKVARPMRNAVLVLPG